MPRYDDGPTRLYVGRLSTRARSRELEALFSKYGRVREVSIKHDFAFVEFSDPRDADDARHYLNGKEFGGHRIIVEFARRGPRGNGRKDSRGPPPGTGRCYNCGNDGHWARDCKAGDWKDKCYRCGQRGHIERNCRNSPRSTSRYDRSVSRSRSRSVDRDRKRNRSRSSSRSPRRHHRNRKYSRSPVRSRSRSRSPVRERSRSMSPVGDGKQSLSPGDNKDEVRSRSKSPSPIANGRSRQSVSRSPAAAEEDRGEESPNEILENE